MLNTGMYTGKEIDPVTGLYYFNARWYDPELGRFITEDPIKDGTNWYVYCRNNPLMFTDPTGLMTQAEYEEKKDMVEAKGGNIEEFEKEYSGDIEDTYGNPTTPMGTGGGSTSRGGGQGGVETLTEEEKLQQQLDEYLASLAEMTYGEGYPDLIYKSREEISQMIKDGGFQTFLQIFNYFSTYDSLDEFLTFSGGDEFFFDLANTFSFNSEGWLGDLINNNEMISDAFYISEWTHTLIADGSDEMNALEHHIGAFMMSAKYGTESSDIITTLNEVRGLIINDRQSGNMINALSGQPGTAFEWKDLYNNQVGVNYYEKYLSSKVQTWSTKDKFMYRLMSIEDPCLC